MRPNTFHSRTIAPAAAVGLGSGATRSSAKWGQPQFCYCEPEIEQQTQVPFSDHVLSIGAVRAFQHRLLMHVETRATLMDYLHLATSRLIWLVGGHRSKQRLSRTCSCSGAATSCWCMPATKLRLSFGGCSARATQSGRAQGADDRPTVEIRRQEAAEKVAVPHVDLDQVRTDPDRAAGC